METFTLYYPVRPFRINQQFGSNLPCVIDYSLPTQQIVTGADNQTCPVGFVKLYPLMGYPNGHNGADLMAGEQNVYASQDGTVTLQSSVASRGLGLGITTDEEYDFGQYGVHHARMMYWHLKSFNVNAGDTVKAGDLIGVSDNTGYSSGDHLHFELDLQDKDGAGHFVTVNTIDPVPYFNGDYADIVKVKIELLKTLANALQKLVNLLKK